MPIKHVFVLMLENRSYDHMLGDALLSGVDAATGHPTQAVGFGGPSATSYVNWWGGFPFRPSVGLTAQVMPSDPGHGFNSTLDQLCYDLATNRTPRYPDPTTGGYPKITNGGFVKDCVSTWTDSIVVATAAGPVTVTYPDPFKYDPA